MALSQHMEGLHQAVHSLGLILGTWQHFKSSTQGG